MYTPITDKQSGIDAGVAHIVEKTGISVLRGPDGRDVFGYPMRHDDTWLLVSSSNGLSAAADESSWSASRVDAQGRGFRVQGGMTFHQALVQTFTLPSPVYTLDGAPAVVDADVANENEAKLRLHDGLMQSPSMGR